MAFNIFGPYDNSIFNDYRYGTGYTYRVWIPPDLLLGTTGQFTLTFGYYSTSNVDIDGVGVCRSAGVDADYAFDGAAERVYFSGNAGVTINEATVTSDPIDYILNASSGLIVSIEIGDTTTYLPISTDAQFAQCVTYRDSGNWAIAPGYNPDITWTGVLAGVLAGVGNTVINILDCNISAIEADAYNVIGSSDLDVEGYGLAGGPIECEAAGRQAMSVIGVMPAVTGEGTGGLNVHLDIDASLPAVRGEGVIGTPARLDADIPTVSCEAQGGSRGEDGILPAIKCEGVIGSVYVGRLDSMLPGIRCEAYCGSRLDERIPTISCEGEIIFPVLGDLDKRLPGITCEAAGSGGPGAVLDKDIPVIECEGVISCDPLIILDATLPGIRFSGSLRLAGSSLDERIPAVIGEASAYESLVAGTLDAMLPAIIMEGSGYGGDGSSGGTVSDKSRFTDYILRYSRWA